MISRLFQTSQFVQASLWNIKPISSLTYPNLKWDGKFINMSSCTNNGSSLTKAWNISVSPQRQCLSSKSNQVDIFNVKKVHNGTKDSPRELLIMYCRRLLIFYIVDNCWEFIVDNWWWLIYCWHGTTKFPHNFHTVDSHGGLLKSPLRSSALSYNHKTVSKLTVFQRTLQVHDCFCNLSFPCCFRYSLLIYHFHFDLTLQLLFALFAFPVT